MITSLRLKNFKNFADETLKLGPFTVIVGANASGKSNIRDAFRFLHGIGRGYTLAEIVGGKVGGGGETVWERIRGAPNEIVRFARTYPFEWATFSFRLAIEANGEFDYFIKGGFNQNDLDGFRVFAEHLIGPSGPIYETTGETDIPRLQIRLSDGREFPFENSAFRLVANKPILTQLYQPGLVPPPYQDPVPDIPAIFGNVRFLDLSPAWMREPSVPGATILGDHGQNLPTVLESICTDPDRKQTLLSWFEELTPMDVRGFEFPRDPSGRVHLYITERNGRKVSAYSASDGTLRFLAILATLLNEESGGVYFFEDIDSGIHSNRLWLLIDLIERQTARGTIQVITTTHSPALLGWMNDTTFQHTSVVFRDEYSADGIIRPVSELPNIRELRETQGLGRLITSGWMEDALALTADGDGAAEVQA
ncbi:MAG: AAA family ATPase [Chloroflexota bacterium]|nr:AAA family ATPase [Chloroflexota bacterium]MDE2958962.1 AAA family ATPase [Chloroflexota bacterium]